LLYVDLAVQRCALNLKYYYMGDTATTETHGPKTHVNSLSVDNTHWSADGTTVFASHPS
jgi:hypothetical protein